MPLLLVVAPFLFGLSSSLPSTDSQSGTAKMCIRMSHDIPHQHTRRPGRVHCLLFSFGSLLAPVVKTHNNRTENVEQEPRTCCRYCMLPPVRRQSFRVARTRAPVLLFLCSIPLRDEKGQSTRVKLAKRRK